MDKKINVLIYPSGGENALEVKEALSYKVNINVFGASSKDDHSRFVYKNFFMAPNVNDNNFIDLFNKLLKKYKIDIVVPTHDTVALKLSQWQDRINAIVITSNFETNKICRHKFLIYNTFRDFDFCPRFYAKIDEITEFPVFVKPDEGAGGKNTFIAFNIEDVAHFIKLKKQEKYIYVEYLPGKEYTVDCFTDMTRQLRYVGVRERKRIWSGISVNTVTVRDERFNKIAESINSILNFHGYWFFQIKEDKNGDLKLMEVSTRPAGTMGLYRQRGVNFILLSIYDFLGYNYEIIDNRYNIELDRCLFSRYKLDYEYNAIYIDLDDTLIFGEKVNRYCLLLLYQAKEKGIPVLLLSKSNCDVYAKLRKYNIDSALFSKIEILGEYEKKSDYIKHKKAIFIDNSFKERFEVYKELGIPVLDTDNIIILIDWRE